MKKIIYISYDGMTDPLGQSQVLPYVFGLAQNDYTITVLSFEKREKLQKLKTHIQNLCDQNNITWLPFIYTKWPPILSTVFDLFILRRSILKSIKHNDIGIIHCRSYLTALIAMPICRKFKIKFVFDMRGFWVDERVEGKIWNLKKPIYKIIYDFFKRKEVDFFQKADAIVSLTYKAIKEIKTISKVENIENKVTVIPCCVDINKFNHNTFSNEQITLKKAEFGFDSDTFILGYLGGIGTWYKPDEMLDFFNQLLFVKPLSIFLIITQESGTEILNKAKAKNIDIKKIKIISAQRNEVPLLISTFNITVFFINPSFSKLASSPTKQGELMSMGIPIINNAGIGDSDELIAKYSAGYTINEFSVFEYKKAIDHILNYNFNKALIRTGAIEYFSLDKGVKLYSKIYNDLFINDDKVHF